MLSNPPIDSNVINAIKAQKQKGDRLNNPCDINGSPVILRSYENIFVRKKTNITTLFNNSSPPHHPIAPFWRVFIRKQCMRIRCLRLYQTINSVSAYSGADTEQHTLEGELLMTEFSFLRELYL